MVGRRGMGIVGVAATARVVNNRADARRDAQEAQQAQQAQAAADAATAAVQAQQAAPADDPIAKVEQLAKLHAAGALTDEEFAAAKAKALGI